MTVEQMFEGISAGTPKCDITSHSDDHCPWASVIRVMTTCKDCATTSVAFLCKGHKRGLESGEVVCYHCESPNIQVKVS